MASIKYEDVLSRFEVKANAYDFLEYTEDDVKEFLCSWIHSTSSMPYVRKLFSSFTLDDIKSTVTFEMANSVDEAYDQDFVTEILTLGSLVEWLNPQINDITNTAQLFASKEEKFYSQAHHLSELENLRNTWVKAQKGMIAERGGSWNSYLGQS